MSYDPPEERYDPPEGRLRELLDEYETLSNELGTAIETYVKELKDAPNATKTLTAVAEQIRENGKHFKIIAHICIPPTGRK